jgi:hypothetical protein
MARQSAYSVPSRSPITTPSAKSSFSLASRFGTTVAKKTKKFGLNKGKGKDAADAPDVDADTDIDTKAMKAAKVK